MPFNPTDKYTIAFVQDVKTGQIERVMKGAPQVGAVLGGAVTAVGRLAGGALGWRRGSCACMAGWLAGWPPSCCCGSPVRDSDPHASAHPAAPSPAAAAPQVVVRNAHNRAEIEEACTAKITEYALRGFRGLGISKCPGDGSGEWLAACLLAR